MAILESKLAYVFLGVFAALAFVINRLGNRRVRIDLPYHQFEDGDDSRERYVKETGALLQAGYNKYSKQGQGFVMRSLVEDRFQQVVLPFKYLKEVKNASENKLSLPYHSEQIFSLSHTGGITHTIDGTNAARLDLNKNLQSITPVMHEEALAALDMKLPPAKDWTATTPYAVFGYTVSRIGARVLVGPELARNTEWTTLQSQLTYDVKNAAEGVRTNYHPWFRWAARWFSDPVKRVVASRQRAVELLRPILEERQAAWDATGGGILSGSKFNDAVQWLLASHESRGRTLTVEALAQHILFLAFGAIESNVGTLLGVFFDLLDHPKYRVEIEEEIAAIRKDSANLPRQALNKLWKLDSFIDESQRLRPLGLTRILRAARVPYTFKDGLQIPRGTQISFPYHAYNLDPQNYPEPLKFDPWRSLRKRQADPEKHHFASISDDHIYFGHGTHACPGRFFATDEIKLLIVHLLDRYEFKWATEGGSRPPDIQFDIFTIPDITTNVLYRSKRT